MAWNEPEDPGSRPPRPQPPAGGWLARVRKGLTAGRGTPLLAGLAVLLVVAWLFSGLYKIEEGERGALLRLGAFAGERGPGLGWHLPWPFEDVVAIDLGKVQATSIQSRLFTSDTALVNASFSVQYQVRDLRTVLFGLRDAEGTLRQAALAEARQAVAMQPLEAMIDGSGRALVREAMRSALQSDLDRLGAGLAVQAVDLTDVQVLESVLAAQRDVSQAGEERTRRLREADGAAADIVARSTGAAQRQRLEAEAYKLQVLGTAEGDAVRFEQLLPAYEKNPQVLRDRLYIETMETILARSRKLLLDGKGAGNTIYLPLDKMFDGAAVRGSGVTGVLEEPATQGAPAAAALAGGSAAGVPVPTPAAEPAAGAVAPGVANAGAGNPGPVNPGPANAGKVGTAAAPVAGAGGPGAAGAAGAAPAAAPAVDRSSGRSRERDTR
jgi:membrane protease subunit HflK